MNTNYAPSVSRTQVTHNTQHSINVSTRPASTKEMKKKRKADVLIDNESSTSSTRPLVPIVDIFWPGGTRWVPAANPHLSQSVSPERGTASLLPSPSSSATSGPSADRSSTAKLSCAGEQLCRIAESVHTGFSLTLNSNSSASLSREKQRLEFSHDSRPSAVSEDASVPLNGSSRRLLAQKLPAFISPQALSQLPSPKHTTSPRYAEKVGEWHENHHRRSSITELLNPEPLNLVSQPGSSKPGPKSSESTVTRWGTSTPTPIQEPGGPTHNAQRNVTVSQSSQKRWRPWESIEELSFIAKNSSLSTEELHRRISDTREDIGLRVPPASESLVRKVGVLLPEMTKPSGTIRIVHPRSHLSSQESGSSTRTDDNSLPKKSVPALTGRPTVFLQEACLLHKWIRTRDRSNVYERPERLRAVNAGLAAAYAQLEYAATARVDTDSLERKKAWRPFDVVRSSATLDISTHPAAAYIHGQLVDGAASSYGTHLKSWCQRSKEEIARSGSEISDMYEQDLYLCPESITAFQGALGTVCEAVDAVMAARPAGFDLMNLKAQSLNSRAFVVVRPPGHHCSEDNPMGFGFVNNVAVGAIHASRQHKIRRVIIFDYDLHHGNGTQAIVRSINERIAERGPRAVSPDPHIFYGSIHDVLSYPCEDGDPEMIRDASTTLYGDDGNWIESIHLQPYATEEQFWKHYQQTYSRLFNTASRFLRATGGTNNLDDDVLIFISSGFDASEYETEDMSRHGRKVPTAFYHRFTRDACKFSEQYANGRIISVLEGGYSDKALISGALAHVTALADVDGLTDQDWWGLKRLDELEKASKKRRGRPPRPDSLDGWLRRTMEIFEALETPLNDPGTTMDLPRLSEEVRRSMGEAARKDSLKRSARPPAGAGPQTRAKRAKGVVDRKREHLEGPSGEDEREDDPFLS